MTIVVFPEVGTFTVDRDGVRLDRTLVPSKIVPLADAAVFAQGLLEAVEHVERAIVEGWPLEDEVSA